MKRLVLETNVGTVVENAKQIRKRISPDVKMLCVVKADAYGHGARQVALALEKAGLADAFAVATPGEGKAIREIGIGNTPVIVLGAIGDVSDADTSVYYDLSQTVCTSNDIRIINETARGLRKKAKIHLAVDTGMSRIGVRSEQELSEVLETIKKSDSCELTGMFTHFCAAENDPEFTDQQRKRFENAKSTVLGQGFRPICHAAASTAMLRENFGFDMVRAGIALYGTGVGELDGIVKPAQTLYSHPIAIRTLKKGETVGYGRTFTAQRDTAIITIPCGYGDGYPRILSGKADVLVCGKRAPIAGRVCMDMLMADVTDIPGVDLNSRVTLLGRDGDEIITPDELAQKASTIPYEIMLGFSGRVTHEWRF